MRNLTINRKTFPFEKQDIKYVVSKNNELTTENVIVFNFKTEHPHGLVYPYEVILTKEFNETTWKKREGLDNNGKRKDKFTPPKYTCTTSRKYKANIIDDFNFYIEFNNYDLIEVENMAVGNQPAILDIIDRSIYECVNDTYNFIVKTLGVEYVGKQGLIWNGITEEYTNEEDDLGESIVFTVPFSHIKGRGYIFVKNTWHLLDDNTNFDDVNITIRENNLNLATEIAFSTSESYNLGNEDVVVDKYLDDVTQSVIPEIIDNEKRQFLPAIMQGTFLKLAQGIEFNLHFRDRTNLDVSDNGKKEITSTWTTTDEQVWNGFKLVNNRLTRINNNQTDDYADEVDCLGFTEDDVRFQKTKIKKSFLRLLFYSSKNLLDKELLYYSTIFLDSGRLYTTYCNIKNNTDKDGMPYPAFDDTRNDVDLRLDARFTVNNKYDTSKSSEGFYLYLFPNDVKGENTSRTIYMKVEFNHAGYGKTIPMILPREREINIATSKVVYTDNAIPLTSDSEDFPITFFKKEIIGDTEGIATDIERYTNCIMIPVNIIYDKTQENYLYYFPWYDRAQENKIIINLWEPRMRGVIDGDI